jgi:hypothetical protein
MGIPTSFSRFAEYYTRHGWRATTRRARLEVKRALFSSRSVLFYCDLSTLTTPPAGLPSVLKVERKISSSELSPKDLNEMTSFWNPKLAQRNMKERFGRGASLWLIKCDDRLAGYSWTIRGRTIAPSYFPMAEDDVQFFDWLVFPEFRGRAIHWFLITQILHRLRGEGAARAFGDAAEWNEASLSSYKMTPFRRLGVARKLTIFGRTIVFWAENTSAKQKREAKLKDAFMAASGWKGSNVSR